MLLPKKTLRLQCQALRERTASIGQNKVSRIGLRYVDISQEAKDMLSRYLHDAAISKFFKDYVLGYRTYIERWFGRRNSFHERVARSLAYLPVVIHGGSVGQAYGVIKDISATGLLLVTAEMRALGEQLTVEVLMGKNKISLSGHVVRSLPQPNEDFPEYLTGVHLEKESSKMVQPLMEMAHQIGEFIYNDGKSG